MDPMTMFAVGTAVAGGLTAASSVMSAEAQSSAMKAQAAAEQQRAATQAEWAQRRANEERAAAQSQAGQAQREARLAQSRLGAVAGASGSGASDPTVMELWKGISEEGDTNASRATVAGEQKASGIEYQAALDRWSADSNAAIKRSAAKSTLIGGYLNAGAELGGMAARYGGYKLQQTNRTGYGGT